MINVSIIIWVKWIINNSDLNLTQLKGVLFNNVNVYKICNHCVYISTVWFHLFNIHEIPKSLTRDDQC